MEELAQSKSSTITGRSHILPMYTKANKKWAANNHRAIKAYSAAVGNPKVRFEVSLESNRQRYPGMISCNERSKGERRISRDRTKINWRKESRISVALSWAYSKLSRMSKLIVKTHRIDICQEVGKITITRINWIGKPRRNLTKVRSQCLSRSAFQVWCEGPTRATRRESWAPPRKPLKRWSSTALRMRSSITGCNSKQNWTRYTKTSPSLSMLLSNRTI